MTRSHLLFLLPLLALLASCGPRPDTTGPPAAEPLFDDIAQRAGITFRQQNGASGKYRYIEVLPGGCALFDIDNDGWLDLFLVQSGPSDPPAAVTDRPHCALYRNKGDGTFTDVTAGSGFERDLGYAHGVAIGDVDNDGYDDLFLTSLAGNRLFRNDRGTGKFVDVTAAWGLDRKHSTGYATSATFGDYDNDGKLDLCVCYYAPWTWESDLPCQTNGKPDWCPPQRYEPDRPQLFHNVGGRFVDVSQSSGIATITGRGLVCAFRDFDGDGKIDLLLGNDLSGNQLWRNNGNGTFSERGAELGLAVRGDGLRMAAMGIATADIDRTGRESVYLTDFAGAANSLFFNRGDGLYEVGSARAGLAAPTEPYVAFGCEFLDFDADGWPDLITANGHVSEHVADQEANRSFKEPQQLFRNLGDGRFATIEGAQLGPLATPALGRGVAVGDLDNDGRLDAILVRQNDTPLILHNRDRSKNHWISFKTVGTRSNRDGLHARLTITAGGAKRLAVVRAGSSYLSASDRRVYFGLGAATKVEKLEIAWPSGTRETLTDLAADRQYTLTEGKGAAR